MEPKFDMVFLEQAIDFISKLDLKVKKKIYYNLDKGKFENDPKFFKKLTDDIWKSEPFTKAFNTVSLHFGTKLTKPKRLYYPRMGWLKSK